MVYYANNIYEKCGLIASTRIQLTQILGNEITVTIFFDNHPKTSR